MHVVPAAAAEIPVAVEEPLQPLLLADPTGVE
jgi:hypothetical protein